MSSVNTLITPSTPLPDVAGEGVWQLAWRRFKSDRLGMGSAVVVLLGLLLVLFTALGGLASGWNAEVAVSHAPPSWWPDSGSGPAASRSVASTTKAAPATPTDIEDPLNPSLISMGAVPTPRIGEQRQASQVPTPTDVVDPIADELARAQLAQASMNAGAVGALDLTRPLGADKWGRDVGAKTLKGAEVSISVGLLAALMATLVGTCFGAFSGWFGGWFDDLSNWIYNVFNAIPNILLILAIAAVLDTKGSLSVVIILGITGWTGVYRLVRGEYLKHRHRDYVRAADAIGASHLRRMFIHVLPNVSHVILVQFSLLTVASIKAEVILSFLGFGVPVDGVSWGTMLTEAQNDLLVGKWWQLLAATLAMSIFVTALSMLTDAVRDALDPKLIHAGTH